MSLYVKLPIVPASFFGVVLGLAGLGSVWRRAHRVSRLPAAIGEALVIVAAVVWIVLMVLYLLKTIAALDETLSEIAP
jgi:tellurite resistance protein